jgi:hypothetical protein
MLTIHRQMLGEAFVYWKSPITDDSTLGVVDFSIFPHLDHPALPQNTMADAGKLAAGMSVPCYAPQSGRRNRRSRVRGALETVYAMSI